MSYTERIECPVCGKDVSLTVWGRIRVHGPANKRCPASKKDPAKYPTQ